MGRIRQKGELRCELFSIKTWIEFGETGCAEQMLRGIPQQVSLRPLRASEVSFYNLFRFKYAAKTSDGFRRSCCNGKTYDLDGPLVCCQERDLIEFGNCLPGDVTIDKPALDEQFYGA